MPLKTYEIEYVFVHPDPSRNQKGSVFLYDDDEDMYEDDPGLARLKSDFKQQMDEDYQEYRDTGSVSSMMKDYGLDPKVLDLDSTPKEAYYYGFAKWLIDEYDFVEFELHKIDTEFKIEEDDPDDDEDDDEEEDDDDNQSAPPSP